MDSEKESLWSLVLKLKYEDLVGSPFWRVYNLDSMVEGLGGSVSGKRERFHGLIKILSGS